MKLILFVCFLLIANKARKILDIFDAESTAEDVSLDDDYAFVTNENVKTYLF